MYSCHYPPLEPYERNSKDYNYNWHKYTHLVIHLHNCGFKINFFALEIRCRGALFSENNSKRLHAFYCSMPGFKFCASDFRRFKNSLSKTAMTTSFIIYKAKFQPTWYNTPLIHR